MGQQKGERHRGGNEDQAMMEFKVETLNEATKGWRTELNVRPNYKHATSYIRRWLFWKRRVVVTSNPDEAEQGAVDTAVSVAKAFSVNRETRIVQVTDCDGRKTTETIWQNRRWLRKSLWQRLYDWWAA